MSRLALFLLFTLGFTSACGTSRVFQTGVSPDIMDGREVNDADIARALDASGQLPERVRVAVYSADVEKAADIEAAVRELPHIKDTLTISPCLVDGSARFSEETDWRWRTPSDVSLKELRLIAARAHCDALVIVDHAWQQKTSGNALSAFNVLLVPALFTPFLNVEVKSYLDTYVFDVRNAYFYGEASSEQTDQVKFATIYKTDPKQLVADQWSRLVSEIGPGLERLL